MLRQVTEAGGEVHRGAAEVFPSPVTRRHRTTRLSGTLQALPEPSTHNLMRGRDPSSSRRAEGPGKNKFSLWGVEARGWQGARRDQTGSMRPTSNAARWNASAAEHGTLFLRGLLVFPEHPLDFVDLVGHRQRQHQQDPCLDWRQVFTRDPQTPGGVGG